MNSRIVCIVTDTIIQKLEQGVVPWHQTWNAVPRNLFSHKPYRGINIFILAWAGFESPYWATFRQVSEAGGHIKKGERGTAIVYWNFIQRKEAEDQETYVERKIPFMRYYTVFNADQCSLPDKTYIPTVEKIIDCEQVYHNMPDKPVIKHEGLLAFYNPASDEIFIPGIHSFDCPEAYYNGLFHEAVHATGHERRLNREGITALASFGSETYSKEELIAELGASLLCCMTGIEAGTIDNSAAYMAGWLRKLSDDRSLIINAASSAQKAVDYIMGFQGENRFS